MSLITWKRLVGYRMPPGKYGTDRPYVTFVDEDSPPPEGGVRLTAEECKAALDRLFGKAEPVPDHVVEGAVR